jgi:hypothetical protein
MLSHKKKKTTNISEQKENQEAKNIKKRVLLTETHRISSLSLRERDAHRPAVARDEDNQHAGEYFQCYLVFHYFFRFSTESLPREPTVRKLSFIGSDERFFL